MCKIWEFLDNGSVAAFLGAFFAFLLVVATDFIRRRNKRARLRLLIRDNGEHATRKLETARTACDLLKDNNFIPSPVMKFPTETVRYLRLEVIDLLSSNENRCIDALLYWMEAIDGLFDEAYQESKILVSLAKNGASNGERTSSATYMLATYQER
jgi:hypothetical protein